jgi:cytoskeletal protein CcmA (bactofilin family)
MFNIGKEDDQVPGRSQNRISHGTTIEGDLSSDGGFRIDGTILGSVRTAAKVVVGKDGIITGQLECKNADIEGSFSGKLIVHGLLTLKATASIDGDVVTNKLAVEPGAHFNATCKMGTGAKSFADSNEKTA